MSSQTQASIIISSYNYGPFLREAIDSALAQTHLKTEVIVVDDGSTDDSPEIITSYGHRIIPVLKENGGQASSWNAGFRASHGEVILFLDADDALLPVAVERSVEHFGDPEVVKVHWPLAVIDAESRKIGALMPRGTLADGYLRESIILRGPDATLWPPTSGNAWARRTLDCLVPLPEADFRICADNYVCTLAPLFGRIQRISQPLALYRKHGGSNFLNRSFEAKLSGGLARYEALSHALHRVLKGQGIEADPTCWTAHSWWHQIDRATQELFAVVPTGAAFLLVDQGRWGMPESLADRRCIPFPGTNGQHREPPSDDAAAIEELERLRRKGASFIAFAWPSLWWLENHAGLHRYLLGKYPCVVDTDRLVVFDLRRPGRYLGLRAPVVPEIADRDDRRDER
jgi:hypothetical protein